MSIKATLKKKAFTLVELLIVVIIIAILAAIAIPKFVNSSLRSKEAALKAELKMLRNATELFKNDLGCTPAASTDLAATTCPATCKNGASTVSTVSSNWKGPYISSVDNDPVSSAALTYTASTGAWASSASGSDSTGTAYSTY